MFQSDELFTAAIGLQEPWYVKSLEFKVDEKRLDIQVDFRKGSKFEYETENGKEKYPVHDTRKKTWRHLNFFEHECYLHCRVPRVKLDNGKVKTCDPPFAGKSNGFTLLFEALLLQLVKSMSVAETSRLVGVNENKIWQMIGRYVEMGRYLEVYDEVKSIGVDETSKAKRHDYISIFLDMKKRKVIYVTEGRGSSTVERFVSDFENHGGSSKNISEICCDLSPAFIKGITENLPNAEITFDKFHVVKIINTAVDEIRREEKKSQTILKNARYVVLKNKDNLTVKQKRHLEELKLSKKNLKTLRAMHIRESFQNIYEAETQEEFEKMLKEWYFWATHSRMPKMIKVAKTIKKHWEGILRWYESKINNGIMEGLNSIFQMMKSRARGYRTIKNFVNMIYLTKGDLNFSLVNSSYPLYFR
jgi:transposase